ncbi:MAG: hypothetical protein NZO58_06690 [Gemmataceae bacterium]|nr:hypothetical protein [Gemmataceae bacterium]
MQVRTMDHVQVDPVKVERLEKIEPPPALVTAEGKPWEEVLECLAVLAAVHAAPCGAAARRQEQQDDDEASSSDSKPDPGPQP